jgi:hypothetical protein
MPHFKMFKTCVDGFWLIAVIVVAVSMPSISATLTDESADWSPIQTRSESVPFDPEFFGHASSHPETLRRIASIIKGARARSHPTQSNSSPISSHPKISSIDSKDSQ